MLRVIGWMEGDGMGYKAWMRMGQDGLSAADICNTADETEIANIIYLYGEERASRRIAKAAPS